MTDTKRVADEVRRHVVKMTSSGESSHVGSCLSIADILAVLYGDVLRHRPAEPQWPDRDRFILSKGHAGAAVYAVLAEHGYFSPEILGTHYQNDSQLSGHVSHKGNPGVEISTGSLGHGLGVATGMALAAKRSGASWRAFALLSDGELDEGSNWEAILFAGHHRLDNLTALIDYNKLQSLKSISDTLELEPLAAKFEAFGWSVAEVNGHDHDELRSALMDGRHEPSPYAVICHTTKGNGVSFMENEVLWHYRTPQGGEFEAAIAELGDA